MYNVSLSSTVAVKTIFLSPILIISFNKKLFKKLFFEIIIPEAVYSEDK